VAHGLAPVAALALVGVGFLDSFEIGTQANLASSHLCDHRADGSMCANVCGECPFSWPHSESEELAAVFSLLPGLLLFVSQFLANGCFSCCRQDLERF
jgi:hypothetical protein